MQACLLLSVRQGRHLYITCKLVSRKLQMTRRCQSCVYRAVCCGVPSPTMAIFMSVELMRLLDASLRACTAQAETLRQLATGMEGARSTARLAGAFENTLADDTPFQSKLHDGLGGRDCYHDSPARPWCPALAGEEAAMSPALP